MSDHCCSNFQEVHERLNLADLEKQLAFTLPEKLTKRPPNTTRLNLEYYSELEHERTTDDIEIRDNAIHALLRKYPGVHYISRACRRPDTKTQGSLEARDDIMFRYITILIDFPARMKIDKGFARALTTKLPDIAIIRSTDPENIFSHPDARGHWRYELPSKDAMYWRLTWLQRGLVHFNWAFHLVTYRHGFIDLNESGESLRRREGKMCRIRRSCWDARGSRYLREKSIILFACRMRRTMGL
ncbi:hypothetical protein BDW74DRAFT_183961 [Aspergillus multicolor]|uniref:uncharacterized protein n=1 Tax=Aspergillus multicolor TaxID=41759 RepID=UPI003CCCD1BB